MSPTLRVCVVDYVLSSVCVYPDHIANRSDSAWSLKKLITYHFLGTITENGSESFSSFSFMVNLLFIYFDAACDLGCTVSQDFRAYYDELKMRSLKYSFKKLDALDKIECLL